MLGFDCLDEFSLSEVAPTSYSDISEYTGFIFCYPLDEENSPYHDHANNWDSVGGKYPSLDYLGCNTAQEFKSNYILFPLDGYQGYFTLSLWAKISTTGERSFFNRGNVFSLGCNSMGKLQAVMIDFNGVEHNIAGGKINKDTWHHVAAVWDCYTLSIFIDGILCGSESVASMGIPTGGNYIGRWRDRNLTCSIGEVRLIGHVQTASYLRAEYLNYCGDLVVN